MTGIPENEVIDRLRALVTYNRKQSDIARECGVSSAFVSEVLKGRKKPSDAILSLIKVERVIIYREVK
ncbi:hypothetical protein GCM10011491_30340 [Brucella endophytica]|uniref:Uncharacterized protein n=1 Tax=Brucella endophytica TaxID=1963359 RepID=A0A916SJ27_9HYPH|nr:hypothetical protein [Brucella endophytica]GGB00038.1 hypothetical protein GCM10011491_30340 [Brucella endophytica]